MDLTPDQYRILFGDEPPVGELRPDKSPTRITVSRKTTFDVPSGDRYDPIVTEKRRPALSLAEPIDTTAGQRRLTARHVVLPLLVFLGLIISPFVLDRLEDEAETEVLSEAVVAVEPRAIESSTTPTEQNVEPSPQLAELEGERALGALETANVVESHATTDLFDADEYLADTWPDGDGDCQSDREELLIDRSTIEVTLDVDGCRVVAGQWIDAFTGSELTNPEELRIVRTVPLETAHLAGATSWTRAQKRAFAVDVAFEPSLMVVAAEVAEARGERGPGQWQPEPAFQCGYAVDWVAVKSRWNLSYETQELESLQDMLATCRS